MKKKAKIIKDILQYILPPEKITVSEWAKANRVVSREVSARPGPWDNSIVPYGVAIMDSVIDPRVESVTVWGSAQVSKTELCNNILCYFIDVDPSPILFMQPSLDMARAYSKEKLNPLIEDTPKIRHKVKDMKEKQRDELTLSKKFPGGTLTIVGGYSAKALAMRSVRIVISDDIDRIPESAGAEGDPVALAEMRAESYEGIRKYIRLSTTTIKDKSRIERLYKQSNMQKYYVPCPHCQHKQILVFDNLIWDKELDMFGNVKKHHPETVCYVCESCGTLIEEHFKYNYMLPNGVWIAEHPEIKDHQGFWINRLYSPFASWANIVRDYITAVMDPAEYRVFLNTSLAIPYELENQDILDELNLDKLTERATINTTPDEILSEKILIITCAVDVQQTWLELLIIGWEEKKQSHRLAWEKIPGNPTQLEVWNKLDTILSTKWKRADGLELGIVTTAIDTGYLTTEVYDFISERNGRRIRAIKGVGGYGKPIIGTVTRVNKKRKPIPLYHIGTNEGKNALFTRLKIENPEDEKYCHFNKAICTDDYFKQLTSEHLVMKGKLNKFGTYEKKNKKARNEVLDLEVYNIALIELLYPRMAKIKDNYAKKIENENKAAAEPAEIIEEKIKVPEQIKHVRTPFRRPNNFVTRW